AAEPRNASVVAIEDVTAIIVTRDLLDQELGHETWLGTFIRALIARFRDLEARHAMTRRVHENTRIASVIINYISRAGTWSRPGMLATSWSRLWSGIETECAVSESAALAIVERTADLHYDATTDEI